MYLGLILDLLSKVWATRPVKVHSFGKPVVSTALKRKIRELERAGQEVLVVDRVGNRAQMRELIGYMDSSFVVCSMMAGSPMLGLPAISPAVFDYSLNMGRLNVNQPGLELPLLNGGGSVHAPFTPGLMAQHTGGMALSGDYVNAVITESLVTKEGLESARGRTILLLSSEGDTRVGLRTDSLVALSDAIVFWPGGFGTDTEALIRMTNTSINGLKTGKPCIFVNYPIVDPETGEQIGYYDYLFKKNMLSHAYGGVTLVALMNLNNQVVIYTPSQTALSEEIAHDVQSLVFSVREQSSGTGLTALPEAFLDAVIRPLSEGSTIRRPYPNLDSNGNWFKSVRNCVNKTRPEGRRVHGPGGVALG